MTISRLLPTAALLACLSGAFPAQAQLSQNMQDWMRRIDSGEFTGGGGGRGGGRGGRGGGAGRWVDGGKAYVEGGNRIDTATAASQPLAAEPSYRPPGMDAVR